MHWLWGHKMIRKIFTFFLSIFLFFNTAYAATFPSYYCDSTFQTVKVGDTAMAVQAACGQPTTSTTNQVPVVTPTTTTQWIYSLGLFSIKGVSYSLPTLTIQFDSNQRVIQIERSNSLVSSGYCAASGVINIGDPMNTVLLTCGQPNFTSVHQQPITTTKDVTEWTYNFGPYKPQIIFDFEGGLVTQISSGQLGK